MTVSQDHDPSITAVTSGYTPGPWGLCYHLQSAERDAACPCGYRGGIWGPDGERIVCEMGSTVVEGEEGLCPPRYDRPTELANARLIAAAPELLEALKLWMAWNDHDGGNDAIILAGQAAQAGRAAIAKAEAK